MKKLFTLITLCLFTVMSAMAETKDVASWDFTTGYAADKNVTVSGNTVTVSRVAHDVGTNEFTGLAFQGSGSWKVYKNGGGLYNGNGGGRSMLILNLKKDDVITFRADAASMTTFSNCTMTTDGSSDGIYKFTVTADGNVGVKSDPRYKRIYTITVTREVQAGTCEKPAGKAVGANGNARTIQLTCETENADIYYSETELTEAEGGTKYTEAFSTEVTTIYAYAKTSDATSEIAEISTGAGSTLPLANATFSKVYYDESSSSFFVTPNSNQTTVIGAPTATLAYYTTDPEVTTPCTAGTPISGFAPGTSVSVVASAAGYASSTATYTFPILGAQNMAPAWTDDFTSGAALTTSGSFSISNVSYEIVTKIGDEDLSGNVGLYAYNTTRWSSTTDGLKDNGSYYLGVQNVNSVGYIKFVVTAASFENNLITGRAGVASTYNVKNTDGTYSIFVKSSGTASSFNGFNGLTIKSVSFVVPSMDITLNAEGFATFSAAFPAKIENANVWTAVIDGNKIVATKVENGLVPGGTGVLVSKSQDSAEGVKAVYDATAPASLDNNNLVATTNADGTLAEVQNKALVLSGSTFKTYTGAALAANKAYFEYAENLSKPMAIVYDGGATATDAIVEEQKELNGKFIQNGKLVIINGAKKTSVAGYEMK